MYGKVSRQSVRGITVPIIGAVTPMHPAAAPVVTPPGGEPPNRVEAEKHISYALTASSVAPVQDWACSLELVEFASKTLAVMFYLHGVIGPCRSSLIMASRHIGPQASKSNSAKTPTWTLSIGSRVWLRLPVRFRHSMISFPPPQNHQSCIGCAHPIIAFPRFSKKFAKRNYGPLL